MKKLILAFALILTTFLAQAQYRKMELWELATAADVVVRGKISDIEPLKIVVTVSAVVKGTYTEGTIAVNRFINTKHAKRWGKYVAGEELLLFLRAKEGSYQILGDGGEGEKLIIGEELCIDTRGEGLKNRFGYHATPTGANIYAEKVPLADALSVVKEIPGCYQMTYIERDGGYGKWEQFPVVKPLCDDTRKDALRSMSWLHDVTLTQADKYIKGAQ